MPPKSETPSGDLGPACARCRSLKKKCDRRRPCGRCIKAGIGSDGCVAKNETLSRIPDLVPLASSSGPQQTPAFLQPPTTYQSKTPAFVEPTSILGPQTPAFLLPASVLQLHASSTEVVSSGDSDDTGHSIYFFEHKNPRQLQGDLLKIRSSRFFQPEKGPFPRILMDPSWSQPNTIVPMDANMVVYIPSSMDGDIIGLFEPRPGATNQESRENNKLDLVALSAKNIYWAAFDGNLADLARQGNAVQSGQTIQGTDPPLPFEDTIVEYTPKDPRYEAWLDAAMHWWNEYKVPREEFIWCHCREVEGNRRLIECSGGSMHCPYVWYHLDCFGKGDDYVVPKQRDWFCAKCRENHPDLTSYGFLLSESESDSEVIEADEADEVDQAGEGDKVGEVDEDEEMKDVGNLEPSGIRPVRLLPELSEHNLFGTYLSHDDETTQE